ncbi:MAG: TetR/AcrR family transcriptional regulator [Chloroflexota bacterium]
MPKRGRPVREDFAAAQKDKILSAAGRVFTERGYQRSTTKAIAEAAGVSEGAIYYHFTGKKDLLLGVLDRLLGGDEARSHEVPADVDFRTLYATAVRARLQHVQPWVTTLFSLISDVLADKELTQHTYQTSFLPTIKRFEDLLRRSVDKGEVRPLDVPLTARLSMVLGLGVDLLYLMGDETIRAEINGSGDRLADTIIAVFLDGVARK